MKRAEDLIVYVDIDDTLVRTTGTTRIPVPAAVEHVRHLHESGSTLYCWSAGGADYARDTAAKLGIDSLFDGYLPKPHVMIDDQPPESWPHLVVAGPMGLPSQTVDDHIRALARRRSVGGASRFEGVLGHFTDILKNEGPASAPAELDAYDEGRRMGLHEAATWLLESLDLFDVSREEIDAEWLHDKSFLP